MFWTAENMIKNNEFNSAQRLANIGKCDNWVFTPDCFESES